MYTTHREPHIFRMEEEECNTSLGLRIGGGGGGGIITSRSRNHDRKPPVRFDVLFPPRMKEEEEEEGKPTKERCAPRSIPKKIDGGEVVAGKEKTGGGAGKKLRLTEEQSALLEGSFREHQTLNLTRKQELAGRLGLKPRQVEVWFQNRRARTKLKQMEANCELLKKCCESLSDENRRLKLELRELRLGRALPPSGARLPEAAAILSMCSSCEQVVTGDGGSRITDDSSMAC